MIISHALRPLLRRAAADLEGFAHSAAAGPESAHMKRRSVTKRVFFSTQSRFWHVFRMAGPSVKYPPHDFKKIDDF